MVEPVFGVTFTRKSDEPKPVIESDMSTIGVIGTAPSADAVAFPLNLPILVRTSDTILRAKLGALGTIADAMRGIAGQLGDYDVATDVVVVRVAKGATDAETIGNIVGSESQKTGLFAFLSAGIDLAKIPRLIIAPGYTHQSASGIKGLTLTQGGTGYTSAPAVALTGGGGTGATAHAVLTDGAVSAVILDNPGSGYTSAPLVTFSGGAGTGATAAATYGQFGNAVVAALPSICSRLIAHAIVEGPGTTEVAIENWRETFSSERLIPVDLWVKVQEGAEVVTRPGVSRVAGIAVRRDYEFRGRPFHSWANQPMQDIVGLVRNPSFSLTDGDSEGQALLRHNIGIAVRGELGVESAIASSGFIFIGTDNAGVDEEWRFYHVTRGRDFIHLGLLRTLRVFLGRSNIDGHSIQAILNTMTVWLGDLQSDGDILGFRTGFTKDANTPEELRLGKFACFFKAEEPPVLRRLQIDSHRYRPALDSLLQDLLTTAGSLA